MKFNSGLSETWELYNIIGHSPVLIPGSEKRFITWQAGRATKVMQKKSYKVFHASCM